MGTQAERDLVAILRLEYDKTIATATNQAIKSQKKEIEALGDSVEATRKKYSTMRESAEKLQQLGTSLTVVGTALGGPFILAAKKYLDAAGENEDISKRWLTANRSLETSTERIGKVAAEAIVPIMEDLAGLVEKAADFAEKNPDAVKGVLTISAALIGIGQALTVVAQVQRTVSTIGTLTAGKNIGAGLATAGRTALGVAGSTGGAIVAGVGAGFAGADAISRTQFGQQIGMQSFGKTMTVISYGLGSLVGKGTEWAASMAELTGEIAKADDTTKSTGSSVGPTVDEMKTYISYMKQEKSALAESNRQRAETIKNFQKQDAQETADYNRNRVREIRDHFQEMAQAEASYYRERLKAAQQHSTEDLRAEEDHQKEMQDKAADHSSRILDLARNNDALGMLDEMESYEVQRQRDERDFQIQESRRDEDFALQIKEMEQNFKVQQAQRATQFKQQMADEAADFAEKRRQAREELQDELNDQKEQYERERELRREAYLEQLQDLSGALESEAAIKRQYLALGAGTLPGRSTGGYTPRGVYQMGEEGIEWTMNHATTKAAERLVGGSLSQDTVLAAMATGNRGGGGGVQVVWNDYRRFDSSVSKEERNLIRQDTEAMVLKITAEVNGVAI